MARRAVYHVTPYVSGWQVKPEGENTRELLVDDKDNAVEQAKEMARSSGLGQVVVHKRDGSIEGEFTYGEDPRRSPG